MRTAVQPSLTIKKICLQGGALALFAAAGAASAATLTVGPGMAFATPCAAITRAAAGDVVEITGGTTYSGDVCTVAASNLTIRGVNGRPRIDAAGMNAAGKGTWVITGNSVVVENVEMLGAKVPDQNGAALRLEGTHFTLRNSFLHDNENGVLSGVNTASDIVIEGTEFGHNGFGTGYTHNVYIGNAGSLTFRHNYSHDAHAGHNLKSRARINTIVYNRFSSTAPGATGTTAAGQPSYEIDLPNAGTAYVIGNVIQQPSANQNPHLLAYGMEGATNPGQDLYVVNNTFLNDSSSGGTYVLIGAGVSTPALLQNNVIAGIGVLSNQPGAIDRSNYRSAAPAFVDRANFDLRPGSGAPFINAGTPVGAAASGYALAPASQYRHIAQSEPRAVDGAIDIGAYEAATVATPPPVPVLDTVVPRVAFAAPLNGITTKRNVKISVTASDNVGVTQIVLMVDGKVLTQVAGATLNITVSLTPGAHVLSATAFDRAGNQATSTVTVNTGR
ncbi:MAG: Ig-like domain-containing protein [Pseudomonadota bacterium]